MFPYSNDLPIPVDVFEEGLPPVVPGQAASFDMQAYPNQFGEVFDTNPISWQPNPIEQHQNLPTMSPPYRRPKGSRSAPKKKANKPKSDKPRRPLSAYNLFFQAERKKLLEALPVRESGKPSRSHGKIGFCELGRTIACLWKSCDAETKVYYSSLASAEKERYKKDMEEYKKRKAASQVTSMVSNTVNADFETMKNSESNALYDLIQIPAVVDHDEPVRFRPYAEDDDVTELKKQLDRDMVDLLVKTFL